MKDLYIEKTYSLPGFDYKIDGNCRIFGNSRPENIEEKEVIEQQREKLRGGESKETLLEGAEAFTSEVLDKYPQVSEDGKLNYYLKN